MEGRAALVRLALEHFSGKSFGRLLRTDSARLCCSSSPEGNELSLRFRLCLPAALCVPPSPGLSEGSAGRGVGVGAVLAVVDELSTYSLMAKDLRARPGVSVQLSAEILEDIPAGTDLVIESDAVKVGASLGFCEVEVRHGDSDKLLARGSHIKYLPMGRLWNVLMHPVVLPWVVKVTRFLKEREGSKGFFGMLVDSLTSKTLQQGKASGPASSPREEQALEESEAAGAVYEALHLKRLSTHDSVVHEFELPIFQFAKNMGGSLHGGAVGMAAERAALFSNTAAYEKGRRIRSMHVQYMTAMRGDRVQISAETTKSYSRSMDNSKPEKLVTRGSFYQQGKANKSGNSNQESKSIRASYLCEWSD